MGRKTKKPSRLNKTKRIINPIRVDHPVELLKMNNEDEFREYMKLVYNVAVHTQILIELMDGITGRKTLYMHNFKKKGNDFLAELENFQRKIIQPNYSEMEEVFIVHQNLVNSLIDEFIKKPTLVDKVRLKGFLHASRVAPDTTDKFIEHVANLFPNQPIYDPL